MLNPERTILPALITAFRSNTDVLAFVGNDATRIYSYRYLFGIEQRLEVAINQIKPGSLMVCWTGTMPGQLDGQTIWKHLYRAYYRIENQAGASDPKSYGDFWSAIVNGAVLGGMQNIRSVNLVSGVDILDTPSTIPMLDEDREDLFLAQLAVPEIGDNQ